VPSLIGIFYKLRCKLPSACLRNIYFSYVYPILLYGIELYANTYSTHLDKLCTMSDTLLRILQFKQFDFPVLKLCENFNTFPVL